MAEITKHIRRKADLEAALTELGADMEAMQKLSPMARVKAMRAYIYDLSMAYAACKLLFSESDKGGAK